MTFIWVRFLGGEGAGTGAAPPRFGVGGFTCPFLARRCARLFG